MNYIGLRCTVNDGKGKVVGVINTSDNKLFQFVFTSPSIYSFNNNVGEILNWHRDNIISLVSEFKVEGLSIKKSERDSMQGRPKNSDIFKLYLEGVLLSLAGNIGIANQHFYKSELKLILDYSVYENSLEDVANYYHKMNFQEAILQRDLDSTKDALAAALAIEKFLAHD